MKPSGLCEGRFGGGTILTGDLDFVGESDFPEKGKIERAARVAPLRRHSGLEPESIVLSVSGFP